MENDSNIMREIVVVWDDSPLEVERKGGCYKTILSFTNDTKDQIRFNLNRYDRIHVESFIDHLENSCNTMYHMLKDYSNSEVRDRIERMLKSFKETLSYLNQIETFELPITYTPTFKDIKAFFEAAKKKIKIEEFNGPNFLLPTIAYVLARKIIRPLEKLVKNLEIELDKKTFTRGRPYADSRGFVKDIALAFKEHIDNPTKYESGPFAEVVKIALEVVGLPFEDPSRAIKEALDSISPDFLPDKNS